MPPAATTPSAPTGLYVEVNDTELRWLGETREPWSARRKFSEFLTTDGPRGIQDQLRALPRQGEARDRQYELVRPRRHRSSACCSATIVARPRRQPAQSRADASSTSPSAACAEQRIAHLGAARRAHAAAQPHAAARPPRAGASPTRTATAPRLRCSSSTSIAFKTMNDSLGHAAGTACWQAVASRVQAVRARGRHRGAPAAATSSWWCCGTCLGHRGGGGGGEDPRELGAPFRVQAHELHVTASIGVSVYPDDRNADAAPAARRHRHVPRQAGADAANTSTSPRA
jgi:hypothetical protein